MIKTTYVCDKCGAEWDKYDKREMICAVYVVVHFGKTHQQSGCLSKDNCRQWCRSCVIENGISEPVTDDDKMLAPKTPISFEEKVARIISEMGFIRA